MRAPPPFARSATTVPPCDSATCRTIARPSPEPGRPRAAGGAVEAVEHIGQVGVRDAGTVIAHAHLAVAHPDLDLAARGAPLGGVVEQVRDGPVETARHSLHEARLQLREEHLVGGVAAGALDRVRDQGIEPHVLHVGLGLVAAGQVDEVGDEHRQLVELRDEVTQQALVVLRREHASDDSTSMFVRRLVSGVRSSCDASATSWR